MAWRCQASYLEVGCETLPRSFVLSSGCWHFVWVPGGRHTSHFVCAWSLSIWNISEKKEIQCPSAGMCIHYYVQRFPFTPWTLVSVYGLFISRCRVTQSWISISRILFTVWSRSSRRWDVTGCWGEVRETHYMSHLCVCPALPEWCREGGCGHHGQRASSSWEICVWDFPADTAVDQVLPSLL